MSSQTVHYKAILAYDGTHFAGFQRQANARTVQSEVETTLKRFGWAQRAIQAAGRTDAGVHASGQVIAFALAWKHSLSKLLFALNANLPGDVALQHLEEVPDSFRPRQDARARLYRYTLFSHTVRNPLLEQYAWRVWPSVDYSLLEEAVKALPGTHDFRAFGTPPHKGGPTIRNVYMARWKQEKLDFEIAPRYVFEIEANAFLFHMVRRLVQYQVKIAQGKLPVESIQNALTQPNPAPVIGLAPPQGLNLCAVRYSDPEL